MLDVVASQRESTICANNLLTMILSMNVPLCEVSDSFLQWRRAKLRVQQKLRARGTRKVRSVGLRDGAFIAVVA